MLRLTCALVAALLLTAAPAAADRYRPTLLFNGPTLDGDGGHTHGHLPDVHGASAAERARARAYLRRAARVGAARFADADALAAMGFRRGGGMRFIGQELGKVGTPFVHFKSRAYETDDHVLDPRRPEALVYWQPPRGELQLVGFMFRAPSLERPPDLGLGPYMLWHAHAICDERAERRNLLQFASDRCSSGLAHHGDTQMTHVWLTKGLQAAYAMEVPARELGVFVEGVPAAYAGDGGGGGHGHGHGVELSVAELVVGNAWFVSVLAPLLAALALLVRRGSAVRLVGIACLAGMAVTHTIDLDAHLDHAAYIAALFCLLIAAAATLGVVLALARDPTHAWLLAGGLAVATIAGFVASRTIGLPGIEDHVGEWGEPAAVLALAFETLLALLAGSMLLDAFVARREPRLARADAA